MTTRDWDGYFTQLAVFAATMGTCCRRNVGCVLVKDRRVLSTGFNGNAPGALHCVDGGCPRCADTTQSAGVNLSACFCVHAEQNALAWCARYGVRSEGSTAYVTHRPCSDCTKLLASAGVVQCLFREDYPSVSPDTPTLEVVQYG